MLIPSNRFNRRRKGNFLNNYHPERHYSSNWGLNGVGNGFRMIEGPYNKS